MLNYLLFRWS